jgi:hypothetical protein
VKKPIPEFVFSHREVAMLAISCLPLLLSTFGCSSFGFFWACLLFAAELGLSWAPLVFSSGFKTLNDNLVGFQNPKWFQQRVFKTLNHNLVGFPDPLVPAAGFRNPKQHFSNFGPPLGASHFFNFRGPGPPPGDTLERLQFFHGVPCAKFQPECSSPVGAGCTGFCSPKKNRIRTDRG